MGAAAAGAEVGAAAAIGAVSAAGAAVGARAAAPAPMGASAAGAAVTPAASICADEGALARLLWLTVRVSAKPNTTTSATAIRPEANCPQGNAQARRGATACASSVNERGGRAGGSWRSSPTVARRSSSAALSAGSRSRRCSSAARSGALSWPSIYAERSSRSASFGCGLKFVIRLWKCELRGCRAIRT